MTLELIYALFLFFFTKLHILQLDDAIGGEDVVVIDDAEGKNIVTTDTARLESVVVYTDFMAMIKVMEVSDLSDEDKHTIIKGNTWHKFSCCGE